jgi:hypothetical protein
LHNEKTTSNVVFGLLCKINIRPLGADFYYPYWWVEPSRRTGCNRPAGQPLGECVAGSSGRLSVQARLDFIVTRLGVEFEPNTWTL